MIPRPTIVAKDRIHLDELIQEEMQVQGNAADLNHIDVSQIQVMNILFQASPFVGNISKWNTSSVIDMSRMFENCPFNGDISEWNVKRVTFMAEMFKGGSFCGDLSRWDTSRVQSMESMFRGPDNRPTGLSNWNVSRVESFFRMFKNNAFAGDLSRWSPADGAYAEEMLDRSSLLAMRAPSFYHWHRALNDHKANMPDHLLVRPQELQFLRPEWVAHFNAIMPLAAGLGLSNMAVPRFIQEQWLGVQHPAPLDWALPNLDAP